MSRTFSGPLVVARLAYTVCLFIAIVVGIVAILFTDWLAMLPAFLLLLVSLAFANVVEQ